MSHVISMPLENEGTDCWRPVHADHLHGDIYEITVLKRRKAKSGGFRRDQRFDVTKRFFPTVGVNWSPLSWRPATDDRRLEGYGFICCYHEL